MRSTNAQGCTRPQTTADISDDLVAWLAELEERPWPEYRRGRPITKTQLTRAIAPLRVSPGSVRIGASTPKGYKLSAFEKAFDPLPSPHSDRHTDTSRGKLRRKA
jgi:hypothetical protein